MWRKKSLRAEPVRVFVWHADAGLRSAWSGADQWRGLVDAGHREARALVGMLADLTVLRILSSPSLRCRQTVVPLARLQGLDVEPCPALGRQVGPEAVLALLADPETESSVLCTHRETLQSLFGWCLPGGRAAVAGAEDPMDMAGVWILRGSVTDAEPPRCEYAGSGAALLLQQGVAAVR
jgi:phosphohistidine phosphatase SixA